MLQGNLRGSLVQQLQMHLAQRQADPWLNPPTMQETQVQSLGQEDPLEKGMQPTPVRLPGEACLDWATEQ